MSKANSVKFNAWDVLGALALEARRVVASAEAFAVSGYLPQASQIKLVVRRMDELADLFLQFERTARAMEAEQEVTEALAATPTDAVN